ncbi:MAG: hypothetical protein Ct9H300mP11_22120 [Chloroflexota bacterium]|nr:MAG: hypothetical protein Ct9H300mP11_22120 [Chloroflexota bacterium]
MSPYADLASSADRTRDDSERGPNLWINTRYLKHQYHGFTIWMASHIVLSLKT